MKKEWQDSRRDIVLHLDIAGATIPRPFIVFPNKQWMAKAPHSSFSAVLRLAKVRRCGSVKTALIGGIRRGGMRSLTRFDDHIPGQVSDGLLRMCGKIEYLHPMGRRGEKMSRID
jgi:hypothetical protein